MATAVAKQNSIILEIHLSEEEAAELGAILMKCDWDSFKIAETIWDALPEGVGPDIKWDDNNELLVKDE